MANRSKKNIVLDNLENIKEWISQGVSVDSIAKTLGVSRPTIYKYVNLDNIYTIKESREPAVKELENTNVTVIFLLKKAIAIEKLLCYILSKQD